MSRIKTLVEIPMQIHRVVRHEGYFFKIERRVSPRNSLRKALITHLSRSDVGNFPACNSGRLQSQPRSDGRRVSRTAESNLGGLAGLWSLWCRGSNQISRTLKEGQRSCCQTQRTQDFPKKGADRIIINHGPILYFATLTLLYSLDIFCFHIVFKIIIIYILLVNTDFLNHFLTLRTPTIIITQICIRQHLIYCLWVSLKLKYI